METVIKKAILAGIGALSVTKDKVEELFDELVAKGQASKDEKAKFVRETMEKVKPKTQEQLKEIAEKLDKLTEKVQKLSQEVERLKKAKRT